jgi:hypothetical protein
MLRPFITRLVGIAILAVGVAACGKTGTSSAPSGLWLAANWSGTLSRPGRAAALAATLNQSFTTIRGAVSVTPQGGTVPIYGTLLGTLSGTQFTFTVTVPAGAFTAYGSSTCTLTGTSTATASATSISGTLSETFSAPCVGSVVDSAAQTEQLSLTRQ